MMTKITNALTLLVASAALATAIASPSLAQSRQYNMPSYGYHGQGDSPAERDQQRREWDR